MPVTTYMYLTIPFIQFLYPYLSLSIYKYIDKLPNKFWISKG